MYLNTIKPLFKTSIQLKEDLSKVNVTDLWPKNGAALCNSKREKKDLS